MALQTSSTGCLKLSKPRRWPLISAVILLALPTLACAFFGFGTRSNSDRVAVVKRLPTLTRTPLPTLSPTLDPSSGQVTALTTEPVLTSPAPPPVLAPTFTPASNEVAASTPAALQTNSPILTALAALNVRAGPGVDYPILGTLAPGESFQIIGKNLEGTWWQIIYPPDSSGLAWVIADVQYATVGSTEGVPVVQLPSSPATSPNVPLAPTDQTLPSAELPGSPTPVPPPTIISGPEGWAFAGVQLYPNQNEGGLVLYGNALNNTGVPQELLSVTGIFYDGQGQVIADASKTYAYWPSFVVPAGGDMPFELIIDNIDTTARYDLSVEAEPNSEPPRQDFEFANVNQWTEDGTYCVGGVVHNSGGPLDKYLVVAAVLYNSQNNLVNFSDDGELGLGAGSENSPFEICVDLSDQQVVRHELQAWGR